MSSCVINIAQLAASGVSANGYWLFDSPEIIKSICKEHSIHLEGASLFYYEAYEQEFDGEGWHSYALEESFPTNVVPPVRRQLEGFDVVTFYARTSPECSPLSCNSMAAELPTNAHCLFASFDVRRLKFLKGVRS